MPILVHFKAKNNDNSYFYKNSGLSFQWVPYYVNMLITALMTFALLDELCLWIRYRQLRQEAREAAELDRGV